jgi:acyl-CoA thioesterase-2
MARALDQLLRVIDLEPIEENVFRGRNESAQMGRLFGGQVAAQALAAACRTVSGWLPHSLHAYFLRGGDPKRPILLTVDRIRDGSSFATRRVVAVQHGRAIFNMSVSFHKEEDGFDHQDPMPEAPVATELPSWEDRARQDLERVPVFMREWMLAERAIELRSSEPPSWLSSEPSHEANYVWLRANGELPDDPILHRCLLAYASDMGFVDNLYRPHRGSGARNLMMASLDHALWFHRDFRLDDWLLYVQRSPSAAGARGFAQGTVFDAAGNMVASVAQEGLMRRTSTPSAAAVAPTASAGD